MKLLPAEFIAPATFFHGFYSDILKGKLGLVTRLRYWISEFGITPDECRAVMKKLMRPDSTARFQYAGQMFAAMGELVEDALKERRSRKEVEERRIEAEEARKNAAPAAAWIEARNCIGKI